MADFSLTTLFVVPASQTTLPTGSSTQALSAGQVGIFDSNYAATATPSVKVSGGINPYFYIAQGRQNTYLQGTKRSDKIGVTTTALTGNAQTIVNRVSNVTEWYKVTGCATAVNQITDVTNFNVKCGETLTLTLNVHSSYIDTLYFNGMTRSVTVQAPCCDCGADPCDTVDVSDLIDALIVKLTQTAPGINPDNIGLTKFFTFTKINGGTTLRIEAKPLTKYGQPCDVAAFPFEFDRMWFRTFVYTGPATTADFIVADNCNIVANATIVQHSNYPKGTSAEIAQLEKNFYSYQAGYLKHLVRMGGYNGNFESWVSDGAIYDTYYIKFTDYDQPVQTWADSSVRQDSTVIIAAVSNSAISTAINNALVNALGPVVDQSGACITTTTTTSA